MTTRKERIFQILREHKSCQCVDCLTLGENIGECHEDFLHNDAALCHQDAEILAKKISEQI